MGGRFERSGRQAGAGDLIVTAPLSARCLEAGEVISAELSSPAPSLVHIPANEVRRQPALSALAALLHSASSDPATRRLASTLLEPLLAFALHGRDRAAPGDRRVARARAAMEARLDERWTVAALAKLAGLCRAAFAPTLRAA